MELSSLLCILQGRAVVDDLPLHEKPRSAKELLASSLLLNLQNWDRSAKRYSRKDRAHHASAAKEDAESPDVTTSHDILPNIRSEVDGGLPVHEQAERTISGSGVSTGSLGLSFFDYWQGCMHPAYVFIPLLELVQHAPSTYFSTEWCG